MGEKLAYDTKTQSYKKLPLRVLLDNTQDVSNLGAALRVCDALCVEYLYCSGDEPKQINKKIRRVARGADSHVPYHYEADLVACIEKLKTEGFTVVALEITSSSKILQSVDFEQFSKIALVIGAENLGISDLVIQSCDFAVHIPMYGKGFSMNVTCALSIGLFEIVRQKNKQ